MKAITAERMKKIDLAAIKEYKIPSLLLMENAGRSVACAASKMLAKNKKITLVCGKGNNAGDGFVCARHLINKNYDVSLFLVVPPSCLRGDAKKNFIILKKMKAKINIITLKKINNFKQELKNSGLIIDAIFGIGLKKSVKGRFKQAIDLVNQSKKRVLAVDLPSGLEANSGKVLGSCIQAKKTVTLAALKTGLLKNRGPEFCGKVIVADISIPRELVYG